MISCTQTPGATTPAPSKSSFTPGPWLIHARHRWVVPAGDAFKEPADALPICQLRDADERLTEDETIANGFLIAAAPDLYEAAEALLRDANARADLFNARCRDLRAALAKARGGQ
jgi:hypothetical protein